MDRTTRILRIKEKLREFTTRTPSQESLAEYKLYLADAAELNSLNGQLIQLEELNLSDTEFEEYVLPIEEKIYSIIDR